ncbi:Hypothetical protein A7982_02156 [Minicystis rosea]|nr:Hypothetical protein A7982_02156 [Minicystis rosea]
MPTPGGQSRYVITHPGCGGTVEAKYRGFAKPLVIPELDLEGRRTN